MLYNYLEFLNEYNKVDLTPDYKKDPSYHGPLFIHSRKPLTLEEIKKADKISVRFDNKLDACDTDSEYIYKIQTKYPIKNDNLEFSLSGTFDKNPFDQLTSKEDKENYSGKFSSFFSSIEQTAHVKTKDITYFKKVGGFCSYDKASNDVKRQDNKLQPETEEFVSSFIQGSTLHHEKLTDDIIKDLEWTRPDKPLKIYKGIEEVELLYLQSSEKPPYKKGQTLTTIWNGPASWSINPMIARAFVDDYPSSTPMLIEMIVEPDQILMDTRKLSKLYYHTDQREITLLPGTYTFKIVWIGKY